ncbi:hypothetical protein [Spirosoma sp.]|uniref:hypothetical protein n=1 Tax=Spirosoma sp. TaxID=1899569 RepID=UPI003B3AA5D2
MKALLFLLFSVAFEASAQSVSPAGLYAASGSGTAGTMAIDWTIGDVTTHVTMPALVPDLTPVIFARPTTVYGTTNISVVVDVYELNAVTAAGLITVKLSKDPKAILTFSTTATSVGGSSVQNGAWNFDSNSDDDYYILTSNQGVAAGDVLSFGLTGSLNPGATSGSVTFTTVLSPDSGGQINLINNTDADKIEFFQ